MKRMFLLAIGLVFLFCSTSFAEDAGFNFESTSKRMVERLLGPKKAQKTRSIKNNEGWSDAFESDAPGVKAGGIGVNRAIRVVRKDKGEEVWETVITPEQRTGKYVNLKIEFDVDSYAIRPENMAILNELGKALNDPRLKNRNMFVNGHTDSDGAEKYNLRLSMNRGQAVKQYLLLNHAISPDRLIVYGYGENMPLRPNLSAANKQLNRRVEIVVAD